MTTDAVETLVPRLLDLWAAPVGDPAAALTRFAGLYTDPVTINGTPMPLTGLVARATACNRRSTAPASRSSTWSRRTTKWWSPSR